MSTPPKFLLMFTCFVAFLSGPLVIGQEAATDLEKQESLELAARAFVKQLADGDFEESTKNFDETMSGALKPEQLKAIWESIDQAAGKFQKATHVRHQSADVYDIVFVTCEFANGSLDTKVVFDQRGRITGLFFVPVTPRVEYNAPDYANPDSFTEAEVQFGVEPWVLPGTLTLPKIKTPVPAIILVHGSGPNDRDETVSANKPFKDLALGLASQGIAILRYDKRTKTHGAKIPREVTVYEETIEDVIAAANWMANQSSIDANRIFMLGHSLGGYLVPRIAKADVEGRIAGFVIVAGNTRPLEDLIQEQTSYFLGLDGEISEVDKQKMEEIDLNVQRVKNLREEESESESVFGVAANYWLDLDGYRPHVEAQSISKPLLILQGERDYQVTMEDFGNWKSTLAGRSSVHLKSYPDLNHLMISGAGPSKPAEYEVAGHVSGEVVQDLVNWVQQH